MSYTSSQKKMIPLISLVVLIHFLHINRPPRPHTCNYSLYMSQPVHDELEYIKMRYRSPARSSFRDQKAYETLTTQLGSTYSSADRGLEATNYSDDSADRFSSRPGSGKNSAGGQSHNKYYNKDNSGGGAGDMPWVRVSPSTQTPNMPDLGLAYDSSHPLPPPPPPAVHHPHQQQVQHSGYTVGQAPGVTVI